MKKISILTIVLLAALLASGLAIAEEKSAETKAAVSLDTGAAARNWAIGVAPRIGLDIPTSSLNPFVVGGVEVDFFLPVLNQQLVAALDVTMTAPGESASGNDPRVGNYSTDLRVFQLKMALDVIYRFFDDSRDLVPFAGLGPAWQFLRTKQETSLTSDENTENNWEFGLELVGGVDYRLGPGSLVGDLRFVFTDLEHALTGNTNAGNIALTVGYRYIF